MELINQGLREDLNVWHPVVAELSFDASLAIVRNIANRFRDLQQIKSAALSTLENSAFPKIMSWHPHSLAQGSAGIALMCGYLDRCFPEEEWDILARQHLNLAAKSIQTQEYPNISLFMGLSGLAFSAFYLSRQGTRYQNLLSTIEEVLFPQAIAEANQLTKKTEGIPVRAFDVVSGLSGVGAYLLCRKDNEEAVECLEAILRSLVILIREDAALPRWHTPAEMVADESMLLMFPDGNLNCGLAHGLPGPLALMSLSHLYGVAVEGMPEAMEKAANWLTENSIEDEWGITWPSAVSLKTGSESDVSLLPTRTAWCYGSPGVARSLWLAGKALNKTEYCDVSVEAMRAVLSKPVQERGIDSPTFCHGVAGLLQITLRFYHSTGISFFREAAGNLVQQLIYLYEVDSLMGYRDIETARSKIDNPNLLNGSPGVILVLLAATSQVEPNWDRMFLLS